MGNLKRCETCYNCRGLRKFSESFQCDFGYKIIETKTRRKQGVIVYVPSPGEPCPKPLTWACWCDTAVKQGGRR